MTPSGVGAEKGLLSLHETADRSRSTRYCPSCKRWRIALPSPFIARSSASAVFGQVAGFWRAPRRNTICAIRSVEWRAAPTDLNVHRVRPLVRILGGFAFGTASGLSYRSSRNCSNRRRMSEPGSSSLLDSAHLDGPAFRMRQMSHAHTLLFR